MKKLRRQISSFLSYLFVRFFNKRHAITLIILLTTLLLVIFPLMKTLNRDLDKDEVSIFLENVMIREGGLYTLIGTKPMTIFRVYPEISDKSLEEKTSDLENFSQEEINDSFSYLLTLDHLKYDKLWEAWMEEKVSINPYNYIMTTRKSNYSDRLMGIFINVPNSIYILSSNYELFMKETGISFDPYTVLEEVGSNSSKFWEKVFENHYLLGILLG